MKTIEANHLDSSQGRPTSSRGCRSHPCRHLSHHCAGHAQGQARPGQEGPLSSLDREEIEDAKEDLDEDDEMRMKNRTTRRCSQSRFLRDFPQWMLDIGKEPETEAPQHAKPQAKSKPQATSEPKVDAERCVVSSNGPTTSRLRVSGGRARGRGHGAGSAVRILKRTNDNIRRQQTC